MRRRKAWFRSLATLLAIWLPLVAGEPGLLQPCPMHGAARAVIASLRGESAQFAPVGEATQTHSAHSHQVASGGTAEADHSAPGSSHDQHSCCSCIDGCSAAGVAFVAPAAVMAEFTVAEFATVSSVPGVESLARPAPEFSRPYTTGPPRA